MVYENDTAIMNPILFTQRVQIVYFVHCVYFFKFKFHQLKSSYKEDCLQSITELWHISKLTFTVIPVKIIPVKRSKFDFCGIFSKNNSLKKVNLGPGACLLENANS